ncbi:PAS/PAC sensor signal transduction histidine kinase [Desulfobulbus propionicus DSM 2032]|uniref:histidine kinase n=1 Tax=Desulfobulbus propionicus (strain ATCC 33891 / DSM 2032 / VKM B-1956 / 1pr3) TaxID=577650 RepID=A0A7U3YK94_DESPD|nr:PAS domain S-box protein [Desulfobulbus propionicus]ADW16934.1 PAS/PAC sensor signal transduction histidine kinase [Desulfobulbus propionicus DSM 2032]
MLQRHIHPDDAARVHYTFATALHHCAVYELEHRIVRPDGQVRWVHNRAYPYCNGKEKPVRYIGATLDITERKQAQQALQASDERFNLAVQAAQEGVWDWNLETDEVWYSPRYKEMLGYAEEEIEHHLSSWLRLLHPDDREPCLQHVDAVKQGEREYEMEFRLRHKDGRYLAILSRGLPLKRASDGKVVRIVGTHLDLTARKRADAALRLSEERLRLALDAARMGAFHWNITTGEVVWTGSYRQVAGISSDMPANYANWLNSLFPEDRESADQQVREAMEKRKDLDLEYRILWPDGSLRWISARGRFSHDRHGAPLRLEGVITDLTERKQMEERLHKSEQRFRALTLASSDVVYCMSPDWREMKLLYGKDFIADTDSPSRHWLERYIRPQDQDHVLAVIDQAIRTKSTFTLEHQVLQTDGSPGWTSSRAIPLLDEQGNIVEWFGAASNITVRKQAELAAKLLANNLQQQVAEGTIELEQAVKALQASEHRYRSVVEDQTEMIARFKPDDHAYTFVNEVFCRFFGQTEQELIGRAWYPEAVAEDIPMIHAALQELSPANPVVTIESRVYDAAGTVRWVQVINRGIFDAAGQLVEIQGVGRDITERKQLEEQLRKSEEKFRSLVETTSECIWETDAQGRFTYLSPRFADMTGYAPEEYIGEKCIALLPAHEREGIGRQVLTTIANQQPFRSLQHAVHHRHGQQLTVNVSAVPVFNGNGECLGFRGVTRDVSEQKLLTDALVASEERFRCLFEKHSAIMLLVDGSTGCIQDVNVAASRFYGYSRENMQGMSLLQIVCMTPDALADTLYKVNKEHLRQLVLQHRLADGTLRTVEVNATPIPYDDKTVNFAIIHDITRRMEIEKEREQYFRLFATSSDLMCIADLKQGCFKKINPAGIELLGYSESELLERPYMDFVHAEDRQRTLDAAARQMREGVILDFENRYLRKNGTICWLSWRGYVDKEEKLTYATARDMTAYKRLVETLAAREEHFRKLFEQHSSIMVLVDPANGAILDANEAAAQFYGYSREELRSMNINQVNMLPQEQIDELMQQLRAQTIKQMIVPHRLASGGIRTVEVHATPIVYQDQQLNFSIVHDITERLLGEKRLQKAEAYARKLIEVNLDPLVTIDAGGRIRDVNAASSQATGYSREEMIGTDFSAYFTEPDKAQASYRQAFQTGMVRDFPLEIRHRDGHVTPVLYNATVLTDEEHKVTGVFAAARDISRLKQAEEQLRVLNAELERKVEERTHELQESQKQVLHAEKLSAIGMLSASIAHEFNNPLQGIMTVLKGLKKWVTLEDEERELVDAAIGESERMKHLIRSLQEFNRPSSGRKTLMNIHQALDSLLLLQTNVFTKKQIRVERDYADDLPAIEAVPDQIKQVFLNLLTNACDACGRRNGVVAIRTWREGDKVAVAVKDSGGGIAPENLDRIFQPFFSTKEAVKGTGLGLSVSHGIVHAHGGEIRVESRLGKGATFTVVLPIHGAKRTSHHNETKTDERPAG